MVLLDFRVHGTRIFRFRLSQRSENRFKHHPALWAIAGPLLADFVLSMPRGATVVYPKDAAMIVGYAGTSDRRGAMFEPAAPDGEITLRRSSALSR